MGRFVRSQPHATAIERFGDWRAGEEGETVTWTSADGKLDWAEIEEKFKNPTYRFHRPG